MTRDGRMRLTVLGGFLGSGKTTWLRHQLHHGSFRDALVVVNEAAEIPVDDALLHESSRLRVLAGGCCCCDGRQAMLGLLRSICDERVGGGELADLRQIVLETSGLADPGAIVAAIRADPVLVHHIVVSETAVAVDAVHGLDQMRREPLNRRQVSLAERFIVTKTDMAEPAMVKRLLATLHRANPGAGLDGAVMGAPAALPGYDLAEGESLETVGEAALPIIATRFDLDAGTDWADFSVWLSALLHARGEDVMRVKGVVRTPAGRLLLQSVRSLMQQPEILPDSADTSQDNAIVFIGRGIESARLRRSLDYFVGDAGAV